MLPALQSLVDPDLPRCTGGGCRQGDTPDACDCVTGPRTLTEADLDAHNDEFGRCIALSAPAPAEACTDLGAELDAALLEVEADADRLVRSIVRTLWVTCALGALAVGALALQGIALVRP